MGVCGDIGEVEAERLAEPAELDFALISEAEFESLMDDLLRHSVSREDSRIEEL